MAFDRKSSGKHRQIEYQRCTGAPGPPVAPLGRMDYQTAQFIDYSQAPGPSLPFTMIRDSPLFWHRDDVGQYSMVGIGVLAVLARENRMTD
jgi:hypothetical protein